MTAKVRRRALARLLEGSLWEADPGGNGWWVHDYLEYNPSSEERALNREKAAERMRRARERKANKRRTNAVTSREVRSTPSRPVPEFLQNSLAPPPDGAEETASQSPKPRPQDPQFEALAEACDIDRGELTRTSRGQLNAALKDIREVSPDVTPDDIRARARAWPRKFPDATLTPTALAKHWPQLNGARAGPTRCPTCGETDHYTPTDQETQCPNYHIIETLNGRSTR